MSPETPPTMEVLGRAGRRAIYHLLQAVIEGLKAVEAVIEEVGTLGDTSEEPGEEGRVKIEIE